MSSKFAAPASNSVRESSLLKFPPRERRRRREDLLEREKEKRNYRENLAFFSECVARYKIYSVSLQKKMLLFPLYAFFFTPLPPLSLSLSLSLVIRYEPDVFAPARRAAAPQEVQRE